ncbi:MAG: hypothetical protein ACK5SX_08125 [Sandaracinobacter sp.]
MLGSRRGRPSLIGRAAGTAARTAVITKTAMSVAGSSAARQQARAHEAELVQAQRLAAVGGEGAAAGPSGDGLEALRKLAAAHEAGILTDAEFAVKVKERLG